MYENEINQSIEKMKIHLTKSEKNDQWFNISTFLIIIIGFGYLSITSTLASLEVLFIIFILVIIFVLVIRDIHTSPNLKVFKTNITELQFIEANFVAAKLNDWIVVSNNNNSFMALKETIWHGKGIRITAILKDGKLYLNSMVNPSLRSSPFSFGINKKSKIELLRQYRLITSGEDIGKLANSILIKREEDFWNESEWTVMKIIKRIVLYSISILFIVLSFFILSTGEIKSIILAIFPLGLCILYVYDDIKLILKKKNKKRL